MKKPISIKVFRFSGVLFHLLYVCWRIEGVILDYFKVIYVSMIQKRMYVNHQL